MGHLIRMANHIADNPRHGSSRRGTLARGRNEEGGGEGSSSGAAPECKLPPELDQGVVAQWNSFLSGPLAEINKKNDTNLVSSNKKNLPQKLFLLSFLQSALA